MSRFFIGILFVLFLGAVIAAPIMSVGADQGLTTPSAPDYSVETVNDDGDIPSAPVITGASSVTQTSFVLEWDNTTAFTETELFIAYKVETDLSWSIIPGLAGNTTSYPMTGLACGTIYDVFVSVKRVVGSTTYSNDSAIVQIGTAVCDEGPIPNAPSLLEAGNIGQTSLTLTWMDNSNIEDSFVIKKEYSPGQYQYYTVAANTTEKVVDDLICGWIYRFSVQALNLEGEVEHYSNPSDELVVETTACDFALNPPVITSTAPSRNSIQVTWQDTNVSPNEDKYVVWYREIGTENYLNVEVAADVTIATIPELECETEYGLAVFAYYGADYWESEWVSVTTESCLNGPGNLGVTHKDQTSISLGWVDTNDVPFNEEGHRVWWAVKDSGNYFNFEIGPDTESATIPNLECNTTYEVSVSAFLGDAYASSGWQSVSTEPCVWEAFLPVTLNQP